MRQRLYFMLPDVASARRTANDLLLARIEDRHMHFLAKRGTHLGELHEASALQKTDIVHGAQVGLVLGGLIGLCAGLYVVLTPPEGMVLHLATVLVMAIGGALLGTWVASMIASSIPNSKLTAFDQDLNDGKVLLMVDVPATRVSEVQRLVHDAHPEAGDRGVEPSLPVFP
jgi:hypothetical protein